MDFFSLGTRGNLFIADSSAEAIAFAGHCIRLASIKAIGQHGFFSMAIPGGATPLELFDLITSRKDILPPALTRIFWTDERSVSPHHPDSNYKSAMQYFTNSPWDKASYFRMRAESPDLAKACLDYEEKLKKNTHNGVLDLVILGVGVDGHTASLFPDCPELKEEIKLVTHTKDPITRKARMTLSFHAINNADKIIVLVLGKQKAPVLRDLFYGPDDYTKMPAQKIGTGNMPPLFIVDFDAIDLLDLPIEKTNVS